MLVRSGPESGSCLGRRLWVSWHIWPPLNELRRSSASTSDLKPHSGKRAKKKTAPVKSTAVGCDSRACIRWRLMCFSSCRRRLTSAPYLPTVPSSTRRKWEWRLLRTLSLLSGLSSVWYGAMIYGVEGGKRSEEKDFWAVDAATGDSEANHVGSSEVLAYVSADEVVPVFDDSPRSDPNSANFPWGSWAVLFESVSHMFSHTFRRTNQQADTSCYTHFKFMPGNESRCRTGTLLLNNLTVSGQEES